MENIDFEKREYNTRFLSKHFYDEKIHFCYRWNQTIYPDRANILKKSIEIIKSGEYSPYFFKEQLLYKSINAIEFGEDESNADNFATEFWEDLYWLKWYEEKRKNIIEETKQLEQFISQNNHFNNDVLAKDYFDEIINDSQQELNDLNTIIKLSEDFRTLINEAFPNMELEKEFARLLKEHNDFLKVKAERFQALKEEGQRRIAEKQKRIEEKEKQEAAKRALSSKPPKAPKTFESYFIKSEYETVFLKCLKDAKRLTDANLLIPFDVSNTNEEILAIIDVLHRKGYITQVKPIHRQLFVNKLTGSNVKDGYIRKMKLRSKANQRYKEIITDPPK